MAIGDVYEVDAVPNCYYVDTGMYDVPEYGAVYLLDTERPAIVDSGIGTNYERVLASLETVGIAPEDLEVIALTHVHLDHAGGAGFIHAETGADVYVHESGAKFLTDPGRIWEGTKAAVGDQIRYYTEPKPVPVDAVEPIHDGATVDLGGLDLDVHHAPGHAFHQVVFHERAADAVFTADAAGIYVPERDAVRETSPPPGFDLEQVVADARSIARMAPETLCYAHFGDVPADDRLAEYVDVVTRWVEAVAEKREELDDEAVVEHFVETADIDEVWGEEKADGEVAMNVRGVLRYLDERET
ncbi:MBL fold metallo-hydrolase [Natronomonas marina]|uniref:MBL fold metallo-hydrolase n=1 Tax=Natronomonas marina TaxID=2961939 RepID=UPI0020C9B7A8|nr:MBL fold metallo-hydrolase [Natronomonas marina]